MVLKALSELFDQARGTGGGESAEHSDRALQIATALLLVEVARADYQEDRLEEEAIVRLLEKHLDLGREESRLLVDEARSRSDHSASLQEFTRTLHEELTLEEKLRVIEMLWQVALADEHLDKHEDHLVRKIAGLLYISHGDVIRLRNKVHKKF